MKEYLIMTVPVISLILALMVMRRGAIENVAKIEEINDRRQNQFSQEMDKLVRRVTPRVVYCATLADLAREASLLVDEARQHYEDRIAESAKRAASGGNQLEQNPADYRDQDFIAIYGAAALGEHSDTYRKVIHRAMASGIRVRRYVRLLSADELSNRRETVRNDYLHWLGRQLDELSYSPNSYLINNVRAPQWGSANSSLITHIGVLEMKGSGESGLAIYDAPIAAAMRDSLRHELEEAQPKNRPEYTRTLAGSLDEFESLLLELCRTFGVDPLTVSTNLSAGHKVMPPVARGASGSPEED